MQISQPKRKVDIYQITLLTTICCILFIIIFLNYTFFSIQILSTVIEYTHKNPVIQPADFLKLHRVSNESNCLFNYGLPENLFYTIEDVNFPPGNGVNSSYRILYNVLEGVTGNQVPNVTYATHMSIDFFNFLPEVARYWEGPLSVSVFLVESQTQQLVNKLTQICMCLSDMSKVSLHFVFPSDSMPKLPQINQSNSENITNCDLRIPFSSSRSSNDTKRIDKVYPINVCRNAARQASLTHYVMISDIELMPSKNLASGFLDMLNKYTFDINSSRSVFVVPIFEVEEDISIPRTKNELVKRVRKGTAVYFHRFVCPHCQKFPGIETWMEKFGDSVRPFLSVKREHPYHRWEPIYIGTKNDPLYCEDLTWEGLQDKMIQVLEMCLLRYKFIILDGAFLIHWPGIKKKSSNKSTDSWRTPHILKNSKVYTQIVNKFRTKYSNHRCKMH